MNISDLPSSELSCGVLGNRRWVNLLVQFIARFEYGNHGVLGQSLRGKHDYLIPRRYESFS